MIPEVLEGLLWLARLGLRGRVGALRASHGYADPSFRPASVPHASLVGPLAIDIEPERDMGAPSDVMVQLPGVLRGSARGPEVIAAGGTLALTFDQDASVQITLAAGTFASLTAATAVCNDIESKLRAAALTGQFVDRLGGVITEPMRVAELAQIACRWDAGAARVTLSSGRRGYVSQLLPSTVEVTGGSVASLLGFAAPMRGEPGRHARQRSPAPTAFVVDVRLDLWAANQRDLGYLIDDLIRLVPTRLRVVTRPALLAVDPKAGDTTLRLLDQGEPTTPESLLHLEAADGFRDRVTDTELERTANVSVLGAAAGLRFASAGTARRVLARRPVVPDPRRTDALAPNGVALSLGLRLVGAVVGHSGRFATLQTDGLTLLDVGYTVLNAPLGDTSIDLVQVQAQAAFRVGGVPELASVGWRVPLASLSIGATLHLVAQAGTGVVTLALDGVSQDLSDPQQTPNPPVATPGSFAVGEELVLTLGNAAGNPAAFDLSHVHLTARPVPALDSRLRPSVNGAAQFRPGDYLALGQSERGFGLTSDPEAFYVRSSEGDVVTLDRPLSRPYRRSGTIVFCRDCFVQQSDVKRRDDLMNRLYRYCVGYRVSALLEQTDTPFVGSLVLQPVVDVVPKTTGRAADRAPGVSARISSGAVATKPI